MIEKLEICGYIIVENYKDDLMKIIGKGNNYMKYKKKHNGKNHFIYVIFILFFILNGVACTPPNLKAGGGGAETDLSDYYTKAEVDELIAGVITELGDFYTREEVNDLIAELSGNDINLNDYYTKTEVDNLLAGNSTDLSAYYTKAEVDNLLAGNSTDLSSYYTKHEIDNLFTANSYGFIASSGRSGRFEFGDQADWVDIPGMSTTFNLSSQKRVKITAFGSVQLYRRTNSISERFHGSSV